MEHLNHQDIELSTFLKIATQVSVALVCFLKAFVLFMHYLMNVIKYANMQSKP